MRAGRPHGGTRRRAVLLAGASLLASLLLAAPAGAYIYWSVPGTGASLSGKVIQRADQDGTAVTALTSSAGAPEGMTAAGGYVYWANTATGAIGRMKLDGTDVEPDFVPGTQAGAVATDGTYLYWTSATRYVGRVKLDGTGANPHCFDVNPDLAVSVAAAGGTEYIGGTQSIYSGTDCSLLHDVADLAGQPATGLAVGGGQVFFFYGSGIDAVSATGTHQNVQALAPFITGVGGWGIAVDGGELYWADRLHNEIGRAAIADPAQADKTWITPSDAPWGLAVDDNVDPTTTSVACQPASVAPGTSTVCTATVSDSASTAPPTGTVTFTITGGAIPYAGQGSGNTCALSPGAGSSKTCSIGLSGVSAGTAHLTGTYGGDGTHSASQGATDVCVGTAAQCNPSSTPPPGGGGGGGGSTPAGGGGSTPPPSAGGGHGGAPAPKNCLVPKVIGRSLAQATKLLKRAGCRVGTVRRPRKPRGRRLGPLIVRAEAPKAGRRLVLGAKVELTLAKQPPRRRTRLRRH